MGEFEKYLAEALEDDEVRAGFIEAEEDAEKNDVTRVASVSHDLRSLRVNALTSALMIERIKAHLDREWRSQYDDDYQRGRCDLANDIADILGYEMGGWRDE